MQARALRHVRSLGPQAVTVLHQAIDRHGQNWVAKIIGVPILLGLIVLFASMAIVGKSGPHWDNPFYLVLTSIIIATVTFVVIGCLYSLRYPDPGYQQVLAAIAEVGDMQSTERLVIGLNHADKSTYPNVSAAIARILYGIT